MRCDQGQKLVLVNEIPAKSASSSLGLPSEEGERWALGDLYQPCCSLSADLTERKHKRVERGGSLGYGKLQIFKFKIWNVFTNSKCVHLSRKFASLNVYRPSNLGKKYMVTLKFLFNSVGSETE